LKPEPLVGFDDVDGEASYLALVTNFVDDIKQAVMNPSIKTDYNHKKHYNLNK